MKYSQALDDLSKIEQELSLVTHGLYSYKALARSVAPQRNLAEVSEIHDLVLLLLKRLIVKRNAADTDDNNNYTNNSK